MKGSIMHCILVLLKVACKKGCPSDYMQNYCPCLQNNFAVIFKVFSISLLLLTVRSFKFMPQNVSLNYPILQFLSTVHTKMTDLIFYVDLM